jgi:hypothetical protein
MAKGLLALAILAVNYAICLHGFCTEPFQVQSLFRGANGQFSVLGGRSYAYRAGRIWQVDGLKPLQGPNDENFATEVILPRELEKIDQDAFAHQQILRFVAFEFPCKLREIGKDAFCYCFNLRSIYLPASLQTLGAGVFDGCCFLSNITFDLSSPLCSIEPHTFAYCSSLRFIDLPPSLKVIGASAFSRCYRLQTITLAPDGAPLTIYDDAFLGTSLSTFTAFPRVEHLGRRAFEKCSFENLVLQQGNFLQKMLNSFCSCNTLKNVCLPASIEMLLGTFTYCISLSEVTFEPESKLRVIGNQTFYECHSLERIAIPYSVTRIGANVFGGCQSLEEITIPPNMVSTGHSVFNNCSSLAHFENFAKLTSIEKNMFRNCAFLGDITIPPSVTTISFQAFEGCISLGSVTFENGSQLCSIMEYAFAKCPHLHQITIPENVELHLGVFAETNILITLHESSAPFLHNKTVIDYEGHLLWLDLLFGVTPAVICNGSRVDIVKEDGSHWIWQLIDTSPALWLDEQSGIAISSSYYFAPCVNQNGEVGIEYVAGIVRVIKKDAVVYLNTPRLGLCFNSWHRNLRRAPGRNNQCRRVIIGRKVLTIPSYTFTGAPGFLPNGDTLQGALFLPQVVSFEAESIFQSFGEYTFARNESLQRIEIPPNVEELETGVFDLCINLEQVTFLAGSKLRLIETHSFRGCTALKTISIPPLIEEICKGAFEGCSQFAVLIIHGENIQTIAYGAFTGCSLSRVELFCRNWGHFSNGGFDNAVPPTVKMLNVNFSNVFMESDLRQRPDTIPTGP